MRNLFLALLVLWTAGASPELLKQSTTRNIPVFMTDSTDNVTGKTGLTLTISSSKDGASFLSITPTVTELTNGWYNLALTSGHTDTLGTLAIHITGTNATPFDEKHQVVTDLPGATVSSVTGSVGSVTGAVGSVTGAVGSVTGNVGGNVTGTVASVVGNVGGNVVGTVASVVGAVGSVTGAVGSVTGNVGGNVVGSVASVTAGVTVTTNNDKTGYALSTSGIQGIWDRATSNLSTSGSIGKLLVDDIDATISSRAPSATALSTATWTSGRAANLDNLDTTVSSRLATTGYTVPPTAAANGQAVWDVLASAVTTTNSIGKFIKDDIGFIYSDTGLIRQDLFDLTTDYAAPIKLKTDNLPASPAATGDAMTLTSGERVTTAGVVWNSLTSGMTTSGSIGKRISDDLNAAVGSIPTTPVLTAHFDTILGTPAVSIAADIAAIPTTSTSSNITAIKAVTDQFSFSSGDVLARAVTVADKTGYTLSGATIPIKKNTAFPNFQFPVVSTLTGSPGSGLTVSCQRSIDGGALASCTNSVGEIGSGYYKYSFSAADLNGDSILFRFFGTNVKEKSLTIVTQ